MNHHPKTYKRLMEHRNNAFNNVTEKIEKEHADEYINLISRNDEAGILEFQIGYDRFLLMAHIDTPKAIINFRVAHRTIALDEYPAAEKYLTHFIDSLGITQMAADEHASFNEPQTHYPIKKHVVGDSTITYIDIDKFGFLLMEQLQKWVFEKK